MDKYLSKPELAGLIRTWQRSAHIYAPVRREESSAFQRVDDPGEVDVRAASNTLYPPKSLFLPQSETLLQMTDGRLREAVAGPEPRVIVGMRPCDARALQMLDKVFLGGDAVDPYWQRRRESATIVSCACSRPCATCFCMGVGSGPFDAGCADAMLIDMDKGFLVRINGDRGRALFDTLDDAPAELVARAAEEQTRAQDRIAVPVTPPEISRRLNAIFDSDFWSGVEEACIGCGVCTFLCPTCHCFDIVDEAARGQRVRNWDTCMFREYSQEASGHNPRPSKRERTRNRIMHKYAYFPSRHGEIACTGCGRCVRHCPVNIDIREIVKSVLADACAV